MKAKAVRLIQNVPWSMWYQLGLLMQLYISHGHDLFTLLVLYVSTFLPVAFHLWFDSCT